MNKESSTVKVEGLSRKNIRKITMDLREKFKMGNGKIDIVKFLELCPYLLGVNYEYVPDEDLKENYGEADPDNKVIRIRESVYNRAVAGNPRDRYTIAHEIGHIVLHVLRKPKIKFCRFDEEIKPYEDVEWQANTFAAEFLVDYTQIKNMSVNEISIKYGVSKSVAEIQKKNCDI